MFDTSVLTPGLIQTMDFHGRALPWLDKVANGEVEGLISTHSLAELYAKLTGMPLRPRTNPSRAFEIIQDRVLTAFETVSLDADDYFIAVERTARLGISGGTIYDALIVQAAVKASAEQIVTSNERDFIRVSAGLPLQIVVP